MSGNNELEQLLSGVTTQDDVLAALLGGDDEVTITEKPSTDPLDAFIAQVENPEFKAPEVVVEAAADGVIETAKPKRVRAKKTEASTEGKIAAPKAEKPAKQPRAKKVKEAKPASEDNSNLTRSQRLKKQADLEGLAKLGIDADEVSTIMDTIDAAPKKVGEKAANMIRYALGREHLSNTTRFTLNHLRELKANQVLTVPDLVKMMMDKAGFSIGTARSQAQQMSRMMTLLGMATNDGGMHLDRKNHLTTAALKRLSGDTFVPGRISDAEKAAGMTPKKEAAAKPTRVKAAEAKASKKGSADAAVEAVAKPKRTAAKKAA